MSGMLCCTLFHLESHERHRPPHQYPGLFAVATGFIEARTSQKALAFAVAIRTTLLSILILTVPDFAGIWQRIIFILAFAWMIYVFHKGIGRS